MEKNIDKGTQKEIELLKFYKDRLVAGDKIADIPPPPSRQEKDLFGFLGQCINHDPDHRNVNFEEWRGNDVMTTFINEALGGNVDKSVMEFWNSFEVHSDFRDNVNNIVSSVHWNDFVPAFIEKFLGHMKDYKKLGSDGLPENVERKQELLCLKNALGCTYKISEQCRVTLGAWQTFNYFYSPIIVQYNGEMDKVIQFVRKLYETRWWFGFISSQGAEKKLKSRDGACFLVRGSNSSVNAYSISFKPAGGNPGHQRVIASELKDLLFRIDSFIKDSKKTFGVKLSLKENICPGSPYDAIFGEQTNVSGGYVTGSGEEDVDYMTMTKEALAGSVLANSFV